MKKGSRKLVKKQAKKAVKEFARKESKYLMEDVSVNIAVGTVSKGISKIYGRLLQWYKQIISG